MLDYILIGLFVLSLLLNLHTWRLNKCLKREMAERRVMLLMGHRVGSAGR